MFQERNSRGEHTLDERLNIVVILLIYAFLYREKSKPYSHCTFDKALLTTIIMSSERAAKGRITDKIGRSFGNLSRLWRPPASSSMDLNSSSDNYIDAGYIYFTPMCNVAKSLVIGRTDRAVNTTQDYGSPTTLMTPSFTTLFTSSSPMDRKR